MHTESALIVAHGQPSDPGPAEADLAGLVRQVARCLPGWRIAGATLAAPGALAAAVRAGGAPALVYPFFMSDGWFTRTNLPRQLAAAGAGTATVLPPHGTDPAVHALALRIAREAARDAGWTEADTALILAAHGSRTSPLSALATATVAMAIRAGADFGDLRTGFIEEVPFLADAAFGTDARSICLPLFVARGGHVIDDIPAALQEAGFSGRLLAPVGTHPDTPRLIADALLGVGTFGGQRPAADMR